VKALVILSLLAGLVSVPVFADCSAPPVPSVPNGATASRDDMLAAQRAIKAYDVATQDYLDCMIKNGGSTAKQAKAMSVLRDVADRFNAELRAFKAKNSA
jgi:hypothetical protein